MVKIFQHRVNTPKDKLLSTRNIEFDVWKSYTQGFFTGHDTNACDYYLSTFIKDINFDSALINIKQTLTIRDLKNLQSYFEGKEVYFIDVPMPLAFHASKDSYLNIAWRVSDYEKACYLDGIKAHWIDPLVNPGSINFIERATYNAYINGIKPIIVSPELHTKEYSHLPVWEFIKKNKELCYGICTKYPDEADKFIND